MNIAVSDVLKHVLSGAALAFLIYVAGVLAQAFLTTQLDTTFQQASFLDKAGYLFQFKNYASDNLESVTLTATHHPNIETASADNGVRVAIDRSTDSISIKLSSVPPGRTSNLFLVTQDRIQQGDVNVTYKNSSYHISDVNSLHFPLFNLPSFISVFVTFAGYVLVNLYASSKLATVDR
jgi:hypothetical protein